MPSPVDLITLPQLARAWKKSSTWLQENWPVLVSEHGFPSPLPGIGLCWDPEAIKAWYQLQRPAHLRPSLAAAGDAEAAARLDAAASGLAAELAGKSRRSKAA